MTREDWDNKGSLGMTRDDRDDYGRPETTGMTLDD